MIIVSTEVKYKRSARHGGDLQEMVLTILHGGENYFLQVVRYGEVAANR